MAGPQRLPFFFAQKDVEMDLNTSLALHARGKDMWNNWAASMIEQRHALVATGDWAWERDSRTDVFPTNEVTGRWIQEATAQFSYHEFAAAPDFGGFIFPGATAFIAAKFPQSACFRGAQFRDGACFNFTRFGGDAIFDDAEFCSHGDFRDTHFLGEARFIGSRFIQAAFEPGANGQLNCMDAKFALAAQFTDMRCGDANFSNTEFAQDVSFERAIFSDMFFLYETIFRGEVLVRDAQFPFEIDWPQATLAHPITT